jgi:hypothetical protein
MEDILTLSWMSGMKSTEGIDYSDALTCTAERKGGFFGD